ncbi:MAG: hypothetical protein WA484_08035, partial [Solirubrobacteraceae bacterium]
SGVAGSLTAAKLAVTAVVVVGSGYGLLGSRAHNRPPPHRAVPSGAAGAAPIASVPVSQAPFSAVGAPARRSHPTRSIARARYRSSSATRSSRSTVIGEFSPERVRHEQAVAPPAPAPAPIPVSSRSRSGSSGAAREFGIE